MDVFTLLKSSQSPDDEYWKERAKESVRVSILRLQEIAEQHEMDRDQIEVLMEIELLLRPYTPLARLEMLNVVKQIAGD